MLIQDRLALAVFCIGVAVIVLFAVIAYGIWSHLRGLRLARDSGSSSDVESYGES